MVLNGSGRGTIVSKISSALSSFSAVSVSRITEASILYSGKSWRIHWARGSRTTITEFAFPMMHLQERPLVLVVFTGHQLARQRDAKADSVGVHPRQVGIVNIRALKMACHHRAGTAGGKPNIESMFFSGRLPKLLLQELGYAACLVPRGNGQGIVGDVRRWGNRLRLVQPLRTDFLCDAAIACMSIGCIRRLLSIVVWASSRRPAISITSRQFVAEIQVILFLFDTRAAGRRSPHPTARRHSGPVPGSADTGEADLHNR